MIIEATVLIPEFQESFRTLVDCVIRIREENQRLDIVTPESFGTIDKRQTPDRPTT